MSRGVIHRLVFERRQAVIEHGIRYVQIAIVEFGLVQLVVKQFKVGKSLLLAHKAFVQTVAIIQQIVSGNDGEEQQHKQDDGYRLVGLRLLHGGTILAKRIVGRHLLKQLGVDLIVVAVQLPLVQGQCGYGTLVANVENDVV